jgi:hypothetical protein
MMTVAAVILLISNMFLGFVVNRWRKKYEELLEKQPCSCGRYNGPIAVVQIRDEYGMHTTVTCAPKRELIE